MTTRSDALTKMLAGLPTLAEQSDEWRNGPLAKGQSRLQIAVAEKKLTVIDEKAFKRHVRERDHFCCRMCGCKVIQSPSRLPNRCEVHHLHGRLGDLRFLERCAICVCLQCHEKLTGRVNERWIALPTQTFTMPSIPGRQLTDARAHLHFERVTA